MEARELLANLSHPDGSIRHKATLALGSCGRAHRAWAPDLIDAVEHGGPGVRFWAATALGRIGPDPDQAVPPLIALLTDPDEFANRQAAAMALAEIGRPAAREAIPGLAGVLEADDNKWVRDSVVRSLGDLAVHDPEAIPALITALDDPDEGVRNNAAEQLRVLGGRARDAVPALRRLLDRDNEPEAVRLRARTAVETILSGAPVLRSDEPYHSISQAATRGQFADSSVPDEASRRLDQDDFEGTLKLLDAAVEGDQDSMFWLNMFNGARDLELPSQHRYYERYLETSGHGGYWRELQDVVRSALPVSEGMQRMIRYCSRVEPNPGWKRFDKLGIDEDMARLTGWLEAAFTEKPPPDEVPGLWFGLVEVDRGGERCMDLYVSGGHPDDEQPGDRVIGGSWEPRRAYAHSGVLEQIYEVAHAEEGHALEAAGYILPLAYGALAARWLATTLGPELLLGGASQRVLAVGFDEGDSIGVGLLRPEGLVFPDE